MSRLNNLSRLRRDLKTVTSVTYHFGVKQQPTVPFSGKSYKTGHDDKPHNPRLAAVAAARQREYLSLRAQNQRYFANTPKTPRTIVPDEHGGPPWISARASMERTATYFDQLRKQNKLKNEANRAMEQAYPDNVCSICFNNFDVSIESPILSCGHKFHRNCICDWFTKKQKCPLCRTTITPDEIMSICGRGASQSPSSSF